MTAILLIVDVATGGKIKSANSSRPVYGRWDPDIIFVVWTLAGVAYGMVELIRRVIPADIVGGHVGKLRRMDAIVHVFYEVSGTAGAFASSAAISRLGNNYSFFLTPALFAIAGCTWLFVNTCRFNEQTDRDLSEGPRVEKRNNYLVQIGRGVCHFGESIWLGFNIVLGNRRFIWLLPSYALALYLHRFVENSLAPAFAKRVLGISAWSQIIIGGSNAGELLGALSVFVLSDYVTTPLPWLRLGALTLNIAWILPYYSTIAKKDVSWAWRVAGIFAPISFGWAAGDVSLAAYIQASLANADFGYSRVSALGAVMAFLYSSYIVLNTVCSSVLGNVIDDDFTKHKNINISLQRVAGIHISVCSAIIFVSTLIPSGAFAFNPKVIGGVQGTGNATPTQPDDSDFLVMEEKPNNSDLVIRNDRRPEDTRAGTS